MDRFAVHSIGKFSCDIITAVCRPFHVYVVSNLSMVTPKYIPQNFPLSPCGLIAET